MHASSRHLQVRSAYLQQHAALHYQLQGRLSRTLGQTAYLLDELCAVHDQHSHLTVVAHGPIDGISSCCAAAQAAPVKPRLMPQARCMSELHTTSGALRHAVHRETVCMHDPGPKHCKRVLLAVTVTV